MKQEKSKFKLPKRSTVTLQKRGGALYALIPAEVAEFLNVGERDKIVYVKDLKNESVLILKPDRVKVMIEGLGPAGLSFSIPKELLERVASKVG